MGVVIVVMASYGFWLAGLPVNPYKGLVTTIEVDLEEATREYFEQRMTTTLAAIEATEDAGGDIDLNLYLSAASDAYSLGDLVTAREQLEKQLAVNSINYVAWNNYALVLEDMQDWEAAEAAFIKTIEVGQGVAKYYEDYADFLLDHFPERRDDLKTVYEEDLLRRGQTVWNMTGLGDWYVAEGECDKAVDHYEVAVVLLPDNQALKDDLESLKRNCE